MTHPARRFRMEKVGLANGNTAAALVLVMSVFSSCLPIASADTLKEIDSPRAGVKLRMLVEKAEQPKAAVILLPGALGTVKIATYFGSSVPGKALENNFLVRTRKELVKRGFMTVLVDVPSDKESGMPPAFRMSQNHVQDLGAIVQHVRKEYGLPVWVAGTSRGTISAARLLVANPPELAGGILTSSIVRSGETWTTFKTHPEALLSMPLERVSLPVLVIHHKDDGCEECPPQKAHRLRDKLRNAKPLEFVWIEGGLPPKSDPCDALAYHGFYGEEERVLDIMAGFIKANM
jgi:pimeloyl-ACP methyl ester carboxylesterase